MNSINEKLINQLITNGECDTVEFKENNSNVEMVGSAISGLANSACLEDKTFSYLIYGIHDSDHEIVGTAFNPSIEKIKNENYLNWLINRLDPKIDFKVKMIDISNKRVIVFEVPSATIQPVRFKQIAYIRMGSATRKLSEFPDKERQIWLNSEKYIFEEDLALEGIAEDQVLSLLDYSSYFELLKQPSIFEKPAILDRLLEEKFIKSSDDGKYDISNLGAILIGKDLTKFEKLDRKRVRVIIYKGVDRLNTIKEHISIKGYAIEFEEMITYINDQLPTNEEIGKAFRNEVKIYPELVIRELMANAIIHQDFSITGAGPLIEIFNDRIEITNPGIPLINPLRFIDHPPRSRNEKLAYTMRRIKICEERGSGIDKVVGQCEIFQLPAPDFSSDNGHLRVTLYAPKTLNDMDKQDKIRACYQHCCLKWVANSFMTNQSLRRRFRIEDKNYATASRIISDTIEANLIKINQKGMSNRYAKYVPIWS